MSITGETTHSKLIAYALLFLGFTGAHRFYLGKVFSGTIYFVLSCLIAAGFWILAPIVIVGLIIDFFLIPKIAWESDRKYEKGAYNYSVAWLLHTFSGVFGAHRFYLGKWGTGLVYLFTLGLGGVGVYYDFLTLNSRVSRRNALGEPAWWSRYIN